MIKIEGGYEISWCGRVYSPKTDTILKQRTHTGGYKMVTLWIKGKQHDRYIHRLVAQACLLNPDNKKYVNHKDGDKTNNCEWNLEWVTASENQKHAYANGLNSRAGENNGLSKLDNAKVRYIRENQDSFTRVALAKKFKVTDNTIRDVIKNRSWIGV